MDSESEPSDSKREEDDKEEEEMDDPNLEWMTQGPLTLLVVLHKMMKREERMNIKFDPDSMVKAEDQLDNFYLQLQTLEVQYDSIECGLFPCTLDIQAVGWYHDLPSNSIQNQGDLKPMILEKFIDDKTPNMLLKDRGSLKMQGKEKVKYFNQRFTFIFNKFATDTKPLDSITLDYYTSTLPINIVHFVK